MTGIILDSVLMLLLVAALAYGVRLEKKLTALRAGQLAFAGAVTELNTAAARAEAALGSLRASSEEADMLHDRILKARAVKQELEVLCNRAARMSPASSFSPETARQAEEVSFTRAPLDSPVRTTEVAEPEDDRAMRMAALAERIQGMASSKAPGRNNVSAILGAMTASRANQAVKPGRNPARTNPDDDLFAA
ncbi:DUF6468 domain-containing protein [Brevundimonas sp.]|uniref:DUF6468 domain-containing protein n=1 Tax=Brevundimonas sp. TaxID=1871086 RepID=UPI003BA9768E